MEKKYTTANNITVYNYGNKHLHSFCICIYIKAGIMYENGEHTGISHMWEHMVFKNINALMDGNMSKTLDRMGAYFNACTYKEMIEFKIAAASKYFDECSKIITGIFEDFVISEDEFNIEKRRVKSEIREEDEKHSIDYHANKKVWKGTVLAKTVPGTIKDVEGTTLENVKEYHNDIRKNNNLFLYVTGKYTEKNLDRLYAILEEKNLANGEQRMNIAPIPKKMFDRGGQVYIKKADVYEVRFSFDIDRQKCEPVEIYLLYDIMFNGESCKIFSELSDKSGLVYSYDSAIELYKNIGNMYFSYMVKGKNIKQSIRLVVDVIKKLKEDIDASIMLAKQPYIDNASLEIDDCQGLNWMMAYEGHMLGCNFESLENRKKAYASVSEQRMLEVIDSIFNYNNMIINIGVKKNNIKSQEIKNIIDVLNDQSHPRL